MSRITAIESDYLTAVIHHKLTPDPTAAQHSNYAGTDESGQR